MRPVRIPAAALVLLCVQGFLYAQSNPSALLSAGDTSFSIPMSLSKEDWNYILPETVRQKHAHDPRYPETADTVKLLYLPVKNTGQETLWYLELREQMEWVEVHYRSGENEEWISLRSGDKIPMNQRSIPDSSIVFPLNLAPGTATDIYLKVLDYQFKMPYVRLVSPGFFYNTSARKHALLILVYSLMFIAAVYNVFLFVHGGNRMHIYYAVVMVCILITLMGKQRMLSLLFLPGRSYGYFVYIFFNSVAMATALMFVKKFFSLRTTTLMSYIILTLIGLLFLTAAAAFVYPGPFLGDLMNYFIIPGLVIILGTTGLQSLKGDKPSNYILLSFIPVVIGFLADNLVLYLKLPLSFSLNLFLAAGIGIHVLFANFGIIMRQAEMRSAYTKLKENFDEQVHHEVVTRTRELEYHAKKDPLTGLLNRKSLDDKVRFLEEKNERMQTWGVIFIDIDEFKHFNDEFGHRTGDLILIETARFLEHNTREGDLVYRYGGDEFLFLMPDADSELVQSVSRRLLHRYADVTNPLYHEISVRHSRLSLSIGGCCWNPKTPQRLWDAIHQADTALLNAKKTGKSRLVFQDCPP
ncbi:MAG: GGDEF domain-containing protein [Spirochaetales bacterium]|nr:GGDEF domain-containing protein [Spirochaetales bacterium]